MSSETGNQALLFIYNGLELIDCRFWSGPELLLTFAESAVLLGWRRPLEPSRQDGVVVRVGAAANFSAELLALDRLVNAD